MSTTAISTKSNLPGLAHRYTGIAWTERTWNPIVGCDRISSGCAHCYAIREAYRLSHNPNDKISTVFSGLVTKHPNGKFDWTGLVKTLPERLCEPLRWKTPSLIFVNSMSDIFHQNVPDEFITETFAIMALCPHHSFQILTKRAERMVQYLNDTDLSNKLIKALFNILEGVFEDGWIKAKGNRFRKRIEVILEDFILDRRTLPLPNVWMGVSVENQCQANKRIPLLLESNTAVRWLSVEPMLGPIDLHEWVDNLDWVVCGAESGPGARPMEKQWARELKDQCVAAKAPFFLKQFATNKGRKISLPVLDGRQWVEYPISRTIS